MDMNEFLDKYREEKFDVSHMRCPHCKVDLVKSMTPLEVPTEKGKKSIGVEATTCPKCAFLGDVDPI